MPSTTAIAPPAPAIPAQSPSGQATCPSTGPLDAEILAVGESPAGNEIKAQEPFVGQAGRIFNLCLTPAGINRPYIRIVNLIPAIAPGGTDFSRHHPSDVEWGQALLRQEIQCLPNLKIIIPMGNNPMAWLMGLHQITKWRGSLFPPQAELTGDRYNEYWTLLHRQPLVEVPDHVALLPTFHPAAVSRQFPWHYWAINDFTRANQYAQGTWKKGHARKWYVNQPQEIDRFVDQVIIEHEHLVAIDTEMNPAIISLVSEEEVHVFTMHEAYRPALQRLMASPQVLKLAHNMAHDWRQFHKVFDIPVSPPWFDTLCGAHILEPSGMDPGGDRDKTAGEQLVGKALSPHIATRYTPWPFHKWLEAIDQHHYCGVDGLVCYDAYWPQIEKLVAMPKGLELVDHDHKLFAVTMAMQNRGLRLDEPARQREVELLTKETLQQEVRLEELSAPHIKKAYEKGILKKPYLFKKIRTCKCCGNGKAKIKKCWSCAGFEKAPSKKELEHLALELGITLINQKPTKAEYEGQLLHECRACHGEGISEEWQPINFDSHDQIKDLLYRVLKIPARRQKGKETINIHQLIPLVEPGGAYNIDKYVVGGHVKYAASTILSLYVERNQRVTELETVERMAPNELGRIHPTYDLWYTPTQRVASRESLHDPGTNAQNLPVRARRFIIPTKGYAFNYPDYCIGPDERILTSDLYWVKAKDITEGLEVIGFDEDLSSSKFKRTLVTSVKGTIQPSYRIHFKSGRNIMASALHKWVGDRGSSHYWKSEWLYTEQLKSGHRIKELVEPWEPDASWEAGYLSGLFDGEGYVSSGSLAFSQNEGPVLEKFLTLMEARGFHSSIHKNKSGCCRVHMLGGRAVYLQILGQLRPRRLIHQGVNSLCGQRLWNHNSSPEIVDFVEFLGDQRVLAIGTEAKTLVVEGLLSHNSQIEARCVAVRCKDKKLTEIFQDPTKDSHTEVAKLIEEAAGVEVSRDKAKRVCFAAMYGIEAEHLATILGITVLEAKTVLAAFFATFTGLSRYRDEVVRELRASRSNTSPTGWKRRWLQYVMVTKGRDKGTVRPKIVKEALATTPQNMAARVLGLGLIAMYEQYGDWLHPVAHVHDAGLFEEPLDRKVEADAAFTEGMSIIQWDMPFPAEPSHGPNWHIASLKDKEKNTIGQRVWTRKHILSVD